MVALLFFEISIPEILEQIEYNAFFSCAVHMVNKVPFYLQSKILSY